MKTLRMILLMWCWAAGAAPGSEPTALRVWTAKGGQTVEAKALQVMDGKVQLERADGSKIQVELEKFAAADQAVLSEHFGLAAAAAAAGGPPDAVAAGLPADDLPYPLGNTTEAISCGDEFHYFLYLPKSLRKGGKHPVIFVMSPVGGAADDPERYRAGAERNRWIIAVSQESRNGYSDYRKAVDSMIRHVTDTLPIDQKRMYVSGFSGGSRVAFATAGTHREIAGVIACGAGGNLGSAKQVAYGLSGTNCFNRAGMASSFKGFKSKDCVLRYFPGQHDWADDELCDDAITHLNGVFLTANRTKYPDDYADFVHQVSELIGECAASVPQRAYLWACFLTSHGVTDQKLASTHATLGQNESNKLYVKGYTEVGEFALKTFGNMAAQKAAAAFKKEAKEYPGTPWEEILNLMGDDAPH